MRNLMLVAAATTALVSTPALAVSNNPAPTGVEGDVNITGAVTSRCQFTLASVTLPLGELSQAGNGQLDTTKVNNKSATLNGWCNGSASEITVEALPITGPSAGNANGFSSTIDYKATATVNTVSANDTSNTEGPGTAATVGLFSGDIVVVLSNSTAGANKKLVAGDYTGQVIVTLTPKFAPVSDSCQGPGNGDCGNGKDHGNA